MNKDKIKSTFKKIKLVVVKYWYLFLAGIVALVMVVLLKKGPLDSLYGSLMAKYRQAIEENNNDLQEVSDIREQELRDQDELNRRYAETVRVLRDKQQTKIDELSKEQETTIREIIAETNGSPEEMAEKVSQAFGIPVSPRVEEEH
jgi:hypothetical protein